LPLYRQQPVKSKELRSNTALCLSGIVLHYVWHITVCWMQHV